MINNYDRLYFKILYIQFTKHMSQILRGLGLGLSTFQKYERTDRCRDELQGENSQKPFSVREIEYNSQPAYKSLINWGSISDCFIQPLDELTGTQPKFEQDSHYPYWDDKPVKKKKPICFLFNRELPNDDNDERVRNEARMA